MVKFTFEDGAGKKNLGLGVSRENINRLTDGRPIRVDLAQLGVSVDGHVFIYFAETEAELMQSVAEFIGPDTKMKIDPRMKGKMA